MTGDSPTVENSKSSSSTANKMSKSRSSSARDSVKDKTPPGKRKHSSSVNENGKKVKLDSASDSSSRKSETKVNGDSASASFVDFLEKINAKRISVCDSVSSFKFNKKRVRTLTDVEDFPEDSDGVVYWMSRDQRVQDNWAFLYAQRLALKLASPLHVCFCLVPTFLEGTIRSFGFMMKGLAQVEKECQSLDIPFHLLLGEASQTIPEFLKNNNIGGVVTDFSPLRVPSKWVEELKEALPDNVPFCQVDAHNLVPCWEASPKLEYGARTIRNKIHNQLSGFLTEFPPLVKHPHRPAKMPDAVDWKAADSSLKVDRSVKEVTWAKPGTEAGLRMLESFCEKRLKHFSSSRNDPNKQALSNLSPWIHFGQISVQRCIIMVKQFQSRFSESVAAFVEEAIIRRELADNFCFYNENYDSVTGAYDWAKKTLKDHKKDERPYLYTKEQLDEGKTHDDLWNAAQVQLVTEGKMHGFLRMYWAKKILEWTKSPEEALAFSIYFNDRYSLDGRDPNGYVGCMWSICGIHDQGWAERAVFGKIRYMNYQGCKRKFDVANFVKKYSKKA